MTPDALFVDGGNAAFAGDAFVSRLAADGTSLLWSTYLGGKGSDFASDIAINSTGTAYIGGSTGSSDFPTTPSAL